MENKERKAMYQLAITNQIKGNETKALTLLNLIIESEKEDMDLLYKCYKDKAYLVRESKEEYKETVALMMDIFSDNSEYAERLYLDLSLLHESVGEFEAKETLLESFTEQFKDSSLYADVLLELGITKQNHRHDIPKAIECYVLFLNKVGKKHTNAKLAALNLSECYNIMRQPEEAEAILKKYYNIK